MSGSISLYSTENKKVPGKFSDELAGQCIEEFVGLRAKQYAYRTSRKFTYRCKGLNPQSMKRITFNDYLKCLQGEIFTTTMRTIRSKEHTLYTEEMQKKALDSRDTKRQILSNGIDTLPWGYYGD